jgi:hypothetical protein
MLRAALCAGALAASFLHAGSALAGDSQPGAFIPAGQVRAIDAPTGAAFENTADSGTLRWRVKQPKIQEAGRGTRPGEGLKFSQDVNPHPSPLPRGEGVRTAKKVSASRATFAERSRVVNAGAFEDPFNDRKYSVAQAQALEPADEEPMDLNAAVTVQEPEEEAPPPRRPMLRRQAEPMEDPAVPPEPQPEVMADEFRRYNDRNCNLEGQQCAEQRIRVKSDLLRDKDSIIDITPPLALTNDLKEKVVRAHADLKRIPGRTWINRLGQVVAKGKLVGVAYRHAVILDESGKEVRIPLNQLGDDEQCFLAAWWNVPTECVLGDENHEGRDWIPSTMTWTASALCGKPNYFEEVQVERYGHTAGIFQPAISGAHFFINIAVLPYKMGINPPNECRYALGYYRPGSCAPWMIPPVPLSVRGAAYQAAAVGIIAPLIP